MFVSIKCRSRYEKFIYCNQRRVVCQSHVRNRRDRVPSWVPLRKLERLSRKSRILKNMSGMVFVKIPRGLQTFFFVLLSNVAKIRTRNVHHWVRFVRKMKKKRLRKRSKKYYSFVNYMRYKRRLSGKGIKKAIKYFTLFACNISNVYKSLNHKKFFGNPVSERT